MSYTSVNTANVRCNRPKPSRTAAVSGVQLNSNRPLPPGRSNLSTTKKPVAHGTTRSMSMQPRPSPRPDRPPLPPSTAASLGEQTQGLHHQHAEDKDRKLVYCGGFSMLPPDEKKRRSIETMAQKETEQYEQYKASKCVKQMNYVGTVGGSEISEQQARQKSIQGQRNSRQIAEKSRQYREETKRQEELENNKKKVNARNVADSNQRQEQDRQESLRQDHLRKNDAFLRRIEQQSGCR